MSDSLPTDEEVHTPGPWIAYAETIKEGRRPVCLRMAVQALDEDGPVGHIAFSEANARLIAAAPDLLAFAKKIAGECAECGGDGQMFWYPDGVRSLKACTECIDVRAVINKAEGRS